MHGLLLAALHWDPQIRGFLIVATALLVLPGSVFLLLSTNVGAKVGFLLATAGLTGWIFALSVVWILYGTGMKGNPPTWRAVEIVSGDLTANSATPVVQNFPKGWNLLPSDAPQLAPAQSAADSYLITPPAGSKPPKFTPPFKTTQDYVAIKAYEKSGSNYLFRIGSYKVEATWKHHHFYLKHAPHYIIDQVQPSLRAATVAGVTTLPAADPTQPIVSVVMVRDVGSLRQPNILICLASFLIFGLCCVQLHRRDKEIIRQKALNPVPA